MAADEAEDKNARCYCTLPAPTRRHLEKLAKLGTHGTDRASVMTFLIMQGIQQAIERNYISASD